MSGLHTPPGSGYRYDLIVVGAGVSGSEVAFAAASAGCDTLLVTTSLDSVYILYGEGTVLAPPAGSLMAELRGRTANSEGYIRSWDLHRASKQALEELPRLHLLQSNVTGLIVDGGQATGVDTWEGVPRWAERVALCVGAFLEARLTAGVATEQAGRLGEMTYDALYLDLIGHGFGFAPFQRRVEGRTGALAYEISWQGIRAQELGPPPGALTRISGLFAAGLCVDETLSYEQAASSGRDLGLALASGCRG